MDACSKNIIYYDESNCKHSGYVETGVSEILIDNPSDLNNTIDEKCGLIMLVNIRSLRKNLEQLEGLLSKLKEKPIVIICTETWLQEKESFCSILGYNFYSNNKSLNRSDGVAMYVKKNANYKIYIENMNLTNILSVELQYETNKNIKISAIYRSNLYDKKVFINDIKGYINSNKNIVNHIIIGDFNININENSIESNEYLNNFHEQQYKPYFNQATRFQTETNFCVDSCIDNAFVKSNLNISSYRLSYKITDHYPLILTINKEISEKPQNVQQSIINKSKLVAYCNLTNWNAIKEIEDLDAATNKLINNTHEIINKASHSKNLRKDPKKPWISYNSLELITKKQELYKKWQKDIKNSKKEIKYKKFSNQLNNILKDEKEKYEKIKIENFKGNQRKLWSYVNQKINKSKKGSIKSTINYLIDEDSKVILEKREKIANHFNKFFCNVGKNLAAKIKKKKRVCKETMRQQKTLYLTPVSDSETKRVIQSLNDKVGGVDGIPASILKLMSINEQFISAITYLINLSYTTGKCPDAFKIGEIVPVYKQGKKCEVTNYRPIALISNLAKIWEKLIHSRLLNFLDKHKILSNFQYGFRRELGTKDAIATVTNILFNRLDTSKPIAAVFLDLQKAFDTVDHNRLLDKLEKIGIRGVAGDLIKSYLEKRKQLVKLDGWKSDTLNITSGVPQGTILGPLLFIIYINDIFNVKLKNCTIISYADDTVILCQENTWELLKNTLEKQLFLVKDWLDENILTLNMKKTVYITFGNYSDSIPSDFSISIDNNLIQRVRETKYLGIIIDQHLKWESELKSRVKRTNYLVYVIAKLSKVLRPKELTTIVYGLYYSVATYGIIAWGSAYNNVLKPILSTNKRIVNIMKLANATSNLPLHPQKKYIYESLLYHYKDLATKNRSYYNTRYKSLPLPAINKEVGKKNHYFTAVTVFNKLPLKLRTTQHFSQEHDIKFKADKTFKLKIKEFIRNMDY